VEGDQWSVVGSAMNCSSAAETDYGFALKRYLLEQRPDFESSGRSMSLEEVHMPAEFHVRTNKPEGENNKSEKVSTCYDEPLENVRQVTPGLRIDRPAVSFEYWGCPFTKYDCVKYSRPFQ
jgi:hypothetical protein